MSRLLLEAYDALNEVALWLLFIGAALAGFYVGGLGGAIGFLVVAFITCVFLVTPFMMISDIRRTVARIEAQKTGGSISTARPTQTLQENSSRIKVYKGKEILRRADGVSVDGNNFANVLEAEKWISSQVSS